MAVSFTPIQPALDVRRVCGCSAMETHFMKLSTNSYRADVASRGSLELGSEGLQPEDTLFHALCASALAIPILRACVAYHFAAEPLLLLDVSTSQ
jgi:hypothetical protein